MVFTLFLHSFSGIMFHVADYQHLEPTERKDFGELVAQLVEQYTFNVWALGSSPSQFTEIKCRLIEVAFLIYMAYVYVLYSVKLDKYYVGACEDIIQRMIRHNSGESVFTSRGIPWELKYHEIYPDMFSARKREMEIKRKKSRRYIEWLISISPEGGKPG